MIGQCVTDPWLLLVVPLHNTRCFCHLVSKPGRAHQRPCGWAPGTPAGKRRGSLPGVLQSPSLACGGSILQLTNTPAAQRSAVTLRVTCSTAELDPSYPSDNRCRCPPGSLYPLTRPLACKQRHVLNERGEMLLRYVNRFIDAVGVGVMFISNVVFAGPLFFLGCFSVAVGMALLYYYSGQ